MVMQGRTNPFEVPKSKLLRALPKEDYLLRWAWGWQDDYCALSNARARAGLASSEGKDKKDAFLETETQSLLPLPADLDEIKVRVLAARVARVFRRYDARRKAASGEDVQRQFLSNLLAHYQKKATENAGNLEASTPLFVRLLQGVVTNGGGILEFLSQLTQDFSREPLPNRWTEDVLSVRQHSTELVTSYVTRFMEKVELIPSGYLDSQGAMIQQFCLGMVLNLHPSYGLAQARVWTEIEELGYQNQLVTLAGVRERIKMAVEDLHPFPVALETNKRVVRTADPPEDDGDFSSSSAEGEKDADL
jgi:hypothetical protein